MRSSLGNYTIYSNILLIIAHCTSYGITNRDEISFVKRLRKEWKEKRPRNKQFTTAN